MLGFADLNITLRIVDGVTYLITCGNLAISYDIAHDFIL
jgi:hypothetical protein